MNKTVEINRYKRLSASKPVNKPVQASVVPKKNIPPIVHKNTKINTNDLNIAVKQAKRSKDQMVRGNELEKLTLKTVDGNEKTEIENVTDGKNVRDEDFHKVSLYEIESYQLIEVSRKESQESSAEISEKDLDLCRKSAIQAAKFFHLAKVYKSEEISSSYIKVVDKVDKEPAENRNIIIGKSELPELDNVKQQEITNYMGIDAFTQTEKAAPIMSRQKKNNMVAFLLVFLLLSILFLFALGLDINYKQDDPLSSLEFWQKLLGFFFLYGN